MIKLAKIHWHGNRVTGPPGETRSDDTTAQPCQRRHRAIELAFVVVVHVPFVNRKKIATC